MSLKWYFVVGKNVGMFLRLKCFLLNVVQQNAFTPFCSFNVHLLGYVGLTENGWDAD